MWTKDKKTGFVGAKLPMTIETWTQSYKQNSSIEFDSMLKLNDQISHVTNLSFCNWSIPA